MVCRRRVGGIDLAGSSKPLRRLFAIRAGKIGDLQMQNESSGSERSEEATRGAGLTGGQLPQGSSRPQSRIQPFSCRGKNA